MNAQPPKWASRFLKWYCRPDKLEEIEGDVYELFLRMYSNNRRKANLYFIWNVFRFFRWKNIRRAKQKKYQTHSIPMAMLKNYFKTGWRNLIRQKAFSVINILGLSIGLTCFMLIASFIIDELQYDTYAPNHKNIYRLGLMLEQNGGVDNYPNVDIAVAQGMKTAFPEIVEFARTTGAFTDYVRQKDAQVKEDAIVYADSTFLEIFSIPLVEGNAHNALAEPNSVVISKTFAKKYFGDKSALGEMLTFRRNGLLKVTGVYNDLPEQSHFHYHAMISMNTATFVNGRQTWSNVGFFTYLVLNEHANVQELVQKIPVLVKKYVVPEIQEDIGLSYADAAKSVDSWKFYLMPIADIHLYSHTKYEIEPGGDINNVYIFGALAVFILLLACINFMNLSTARSARRGLEIGVRKTLGAFKTQLMLQFLVESVILSMIALVIALTLVFMLLPYFNILTGKHFDISSFLTPQSLVWLITLGLLVGLLAGGYPAVFLSSFQTLRMLKGSATGGARRGGLRSALVVFQFAISTALIIATLIAYQQLHFMQDIKLGYDKDQILVIENAGALQTNEIAFKQKLQQDHRVLQVSNSTVPIGTANSFGGTEVFAKDKVGSNIHISVFTMDYDYLETLNLEVLVGRNFSREFPSDSLGENVVINETAMRDLGWDESNVIGATIVRSAEAHHQVVGVIKDFHYTSAKDKIAPLMLYYRGYSSSMLVKVESSKIKEFVDDLGKQWTAFNVDVPMSYYFLDDQFDHLYKSEQTTEQIFIVFMVVAVLIASMGLYGLSAYAAEQRVKEIGIRKVMGSTVGQIVVLQSKEFLILVMVSIIIAAPLSWWAMHNWLQNFGYRIQINGWIILLAGGVAILLALITVSFQAIKAAVANPATSLKAE